MKPRKESDIDWERRKRMKKYKALVKAYLRDHRLGMTLFLAEVFLLVTVIELSDISKEISRYLLTLHLFVFLVAFLVSFISYKKQYLHWLLIREKKEEAHWFGEHWKTDSSELMKLCEEVIAAQGALLQLQEEESRKKLWRHQEYYAMWVHQMKTPIFALELLHRTVEDSAAQSQMKAELLKIKDYTQVALQYIRMENMAADLDLKPCDLSTVVKNQLKKYSVFFINQKIRLQLEEFDIKVTTDEKWLSFVIGQILTNSLKYTAASGEIKIYFREDSLVIEDTGLGIRTEDIPKLFHRGFTGTNGRLQKEASGMGLYLSAQVMRTLGHNIRLESSLGVGTKVFLEFPENMVEAY